MIRLFWYTLALIITLSFSIFAVATYFYLNTEAIKDVVFYYPYIT